MSAGTTDIRPRRERRLHSALASRRDHRRRAGRHLHPACRCSPGGHDDFVILEQGAGPSRHLVPQPLSGRRMRHQVRISTRSRSRPNPGVVAPVRGPARDQGLPRGRPSTASVSARTSACSTPVRSMRWDDDASVWQLTVGDGEGSDEIVDAATSSSARSACSASPSNPRSPGLDRFQGTMFHFRRLGRRPRPSPANASRVIGSAASAVQLIPEIAPVVESPHRLPAHRPTGCRPRTTTRTPTTSWRRSPPIRCRSGRRATRSSPPSTPTSPSPTHRTARRSTSRTDDATSTFVEDDELRARLTPVGPYGSKRPLASNAYYPTFNLPHVELS